MCAVFFPPGMPADSDQDDVAVDVGDATDGPGGLTKRKGEPMSFASKKSRLDDGHYLYNNNNNNNSINNNNNNIPLRKAMDKRSMDSVLRKLTLGTGMRSPSPSHVALQQGDG